MHKHWRIAALLLTAPLQLSAQSTFGTILGTVTDASGAVVPQAKIVITNQGENTSRNVSTDVQGNFEALNLKACSYTDGQDRRLQEIQNQRAGVDGPAD